MEISQVKRNLRKTVLYDMGQMNIGGNSLQEYIFSACILRKKKDMKLYYQAELRDPSNKKTAIIVPLEKVIVRGYNA